MTDIAVISYLNLVLMTANQATSILSCGILSVLILNEKFSPKYDLSSWITILLGCSLIIIYANKDEQNLEIAFYVERVTRLANFICFGTLVASFLIAILTVDSLIKRKADLFRKDATKFIEKTEEDFEGDPDRK